MPVEFRASSRRTGLRGRDLCPPPRPGLVSSDTQPPPVSGRLEEGLSLGPVCRCAEDLLPVLQVRARRPEVRSARRRPPIGRLRLPPAASKAELWL